MGLRLEIVSATGRRISDRSLIGRTLAEGLQAARSDLESATGEELPETALRDYDMPAHPVQDGEPFTEPSPAEMMEIGRWLCNFAVLFGDLESSASERPAVRSVDAARVWPHHFDLGTLLQLNDDALPFAKGQLQSIGVGLAPDDEDIAEPYLYVNPYPSPEPTSPLPELGTLGHWQREGFVGAVLSGSEIVAAGDPSAQEALVRRFLDRALAVFLGD